MVVVGGKGHEFVSVARINAGGFHHTQEHVLTELHLGCTGDFVCTSVVGFLVRRRFGLLARFSLFGRFGFNSRQIIGFDFVTEVNAMETVQGFCIHFTAALDVKGHLEAFAFLDLGHVPDDVETTLAVFGGHGDIVSLATGALELPVLDLKLGRQDVVDVQVAEGCVAVVFEQNQHFIAALATQRDGLLAGAEVSAVVDDLHAGRVGGFSRADGAKAFCAELDTGGCVNALVAG